MACDSPTAGIFFAPASLVFLLKELESGTGFKFVVVAQDKSNTLKYVYADYN
jgi:hypothetical protein